MADVAATTRPPAPEQLFLFPWAPLAPVPPAAIHGDAAISPCGQYRWWLRRWWRAGPCVAWILLNPSTADAGKDDPTLCRVVQFTRSWGYGGLVVVNLYPIRTPDPAACRRWMTMAEGEDDWTIDAANALRRNRDVVVERVTGADLVVAAWGAGAWDQELVRRICLAVRMTPRQPALHCLGTTESGAPKHPLARGRHRVPPDQNPVLWGPPEDDDE